jgi:glutamate dehydrogenase
MEGRIAAAIRVLENQRSTGLARQLAPFLFALVNPDDVAAFSPEALAALIRSAADALAGHRPGRSVIRIGAAPKGSNSIVEIATDDAPFLLDSTLAELHERSLDIRLVAHPTLDVERDESGRPVAIHPRITGTSKAGSVSLIQIEIAQSLTREQQKDLHSGLAAVLADVKAAVTGWRGMLARLEATIASYEAHPPPLDRGEVAEAVAFLRWLMADDFVFLGIRQYDLTAAGRELRRHAGPGLGILADPERIVFGRGGKPVTITPAIREFLAGPELLLIGKANVKSRVHRRVYMDYVGVKLFSHEGKVTGELRIVGLFTSSAYTRSVRTIPYVRRKAERIIARAGYAPDSHSGKALLNIIETYPRDELFQIDETLLSRFASDILALEERPRIRVLLRRDKYDRYVSALVYVPRDRYTTTVRIAIGDYLARAFSGHVSAFYPAFPEGTLTRVHFIIGRDENPAPEIAREVLEDAVAAIVRTWADGLREALSQERKPAEAERLLSLYGHAFPDAYRNDFYPKAALYDIAALESLRDDSTIAVQVYRRHGVAPSRLSFKIAHLASPIDLSIRVPMLENFGFRVIDERTYRVDLPGNRPPAFIHDMALETATAEAVDIDTLGGPLREAFLAVWSGRAESDGYNALVINAALGWPEVALLRAISRYLRQAGIPYSHEYMAVTLNKQADIAAEIVRRFLALFQPPGGNAKDAETLAAVIDGALASVDSLDEDRILRRFANVVDATVRTNYFSTFDGEAANPVLTLKLDSTKLDELPKPVPFREIIVYSPRVEGIHLRFGRIARGGIRWSDRPEDYRTEVLGLVKAQQVKNAVIVPVGAKGGFVPKRLPSGPRDAILAEGTAVYEIFIASLLDITDNIEGDKVVPPANVVRRDGDDPYFVVAADKGTATFSDIANAVSQAHHFWLDDAFASGGSAGYDHKAMGITARGAWEAVKRHFREMDVDIQTTPFTVVGVGDMSGDVFGNGMLLSPAIRLVAAFDHRDIFLDPDPEPRAALKERRRLFRLPRSSWQDYDREKISAGGGIFSRRDKAIPISREVKALLGINADRLAPTDLIRAILTAQVDLLWFGGIGTYVRGTSETNADVGDRANDALRVAGRDLRAKVVGEGANLAMTQPARIEYGLAGGRCNSDAIDNSAGVNTSDVEVNIKIAFGTAMRAGKLDRQERNRQLAAMTDEVAALVLRNNYLQTLAISLAAARGFEDFPFQQRLMQALETAGRLDRKVEALPDDLAMAERQAAGKPLTRAEIGVLLAHAKISLYDELLTGDGPDDPAIGAELFRYFPATMHKPWRREIEKHPLRREIIATVVANAMINRGGPTFMTRVADRGGGTSGDIARAFFAVREAFQIEELCAEVDALDTRISGAVQTGLYLAIGEVVLSRTLWFLRNVPLAGDLRPVIAVYAKAVSAIEKIIPAGLPNAIAADLNAAAGAFVAAGVPEAVATRIAALPVLADATEIHLVAEKAGTKLARAAVAYFAVGEHFRIAHIDTAARRLPVTDYYDGLALDRALQRLSEARRAIAAGALAENASHAAPFAKWLDTRRAAIERIVARVRQITEGDELTVSRVAVAAHLLAELARE